MATTISATLYWLLATYFHNSLVQSMFDEADEFPSMAKAYLDMEVTNVVNDMGLFAHLFEESFFHPERPQHIYFKHIIRELHEHREQYLQIRLLDLQGFESFRSENVNQSVYIAGEEELQDKSDRYYFTESQPLRESQIHVSKLDLNIEHGELEIPFVPVLRLSTPAHIDGKKQGYLVLNLRMEDLFEKILKIANQASDYDRLMLNVDGHYYLGFADQEEWGHLLPQRQQFTFAQLAPAQWEFIQQTRSGCAEHNHSIVCHLSFEPVSFYDVESGRQMWDVNEKWRLVSYYSPELMAERFHPIALNLLWFSLLFGLSLFVALHYYDANVARRHELRNREEQLRNQKTNVESLQQIIRRISHEINNPLAQLQLYYDLLAKKIRKIDPENPQLIQLFAKGQAAIQKIAEITQVLHQVEFEEVQDLALVSIQPLLVPTLDSFRSRFPDTEWREVVVGRPQQVLASASHLQQAISLLLENAAEATAGQDKAVVEVVVSSVEQGKQDFVRVEISDNGPGVAPQLVHSLFRPFFTTKGFEHPGLGLSTAHQLMSMMKGRIYYQPHPKGGAQFVLEFPTAA